MPKPKISPIRKSAERLKEVTLKDVRLKEANFELIDLTIFQLRAIEERKNPVNGRYVAAFNGKKQILQMYPKLREAFVSKPQKQINQSPIQSNPIHAANKIPDTYVEPLAQPNLRPAQAPEFAPPPIIKEAVYANNGPQEVASSNVVSLDEYRASKANGQPEAGTPPTDSESNVVSLDEYRASKANGQPEAPTPSGELNEQQVQEDMLATARAKIQTIYPQSESKAS